VTIIHRFENDTATVFAQMSDAAMLKARCKALGEKNIQCSVEQQGRKTAVKLSRTVKRDLPKVLAAMFNPENTINMVETWENIGEVYMGSYVADVVGQPVTLLAKFKLKPCDEGCEYSIDYQCKASIPLVGRKIEEFIISQTSAGLEQEIDWLKQNLRALSPA
jgi:hypothetical protein